MYFLIIKPISGMKDLCIKIKNFTLNNLAYTRKRNLYPRVYYDYALIFELMFQRGGSFSFSFSKV